MQDILIVKYGKNWALKLKNKRKDNYWAYLYTTLGQAQEVMERIRENWRPLTGEVNFCWDKPLGFAKDIHKKA